MNNNDTFLTTLKRQLRLNFLELIAVLLAIIAIIISLTTANSQKKWLQSSTRPVLAMEFLKADTEEWKGFLLRNVGFGPAVITSYKYYKNEAEYKNKISHSEWLRPNGISRALLLGFQFHQINNPTPGFVLGKEQELFLLGTLQEEFSLTPTSQSMAETIVEIEYKSVNHADDNTYYLRFCENFTTNNITDRNAAHTYENVRR